MKEPPRWTEEQLATDAQAAKAIFRRERLDEPLQRWKDTFDKHRQQFQELFDTYGLTDPAQITPDRVAELLRTHLGEALRYLAGPPISGDDLKVLAETGSISQKALRENPEISARIAEIIVRTLDPRRFPWIEQNRPPTDQEKATAIVASAALIAAQRLATTRRNESKAAQEKAVKQYLNGLGFVEVKRRDIRNMSNAPAAGEYCSESKVADRKADVPVGLYDGRLMAIECKVSNSSLNSVKRINNDAAAKADQWLKDLGPKNIVPTAVISGVFNVDNLVQAQKKGLTIFWSHRLDDLGEFIAATKS